MRENQGGNNIYIYFRNYVLFSSLKLFKKKNRRRIIGIFTKYIFNTSFWLDFMAFI